MDVKIGVAEDEKMDMSGKAPEVPEIIDVGCPFMKVVRESIPAEVCGDASIKELELTFIDADAVNDD